MAVKLSASYSYEGVKDVWRSLFEFNFLVTDFQ